MKTVGEQISSHSLHCLWLPLVTLTLLLPSLNHKNTTHTTYAHVKTQMSMVVTCFSVLQRARTWIFLWAKLGHLAEVLIFYDILIPFNHGLWKKGPLKLIYTWCFSNSDVCTNHRKTFKNVDSEWVILLLGFWACVSKGSRVVWRLQPMLGEVMKKRNHRQ